LEIIDDRLACFFKYVCESRLIVPVVIVILGSRMSFGSKDDLEGDQFEYIKLWEDGNLVRS